jgi:hypothetical protein
VRSQKHVSRAPRAGGRSRARVLCIAIPESMWIFHLYMKHHLHPQSLSLERRILCWESLALPYSQRHHHRPSIVLLTRLQGFIFLLKIMELVSTVLIVSLCKVACLIWRSLVSKVILHAIFCAVFLSKLYSSTSFLD